MAEKEIEYVIKIMKNEEMPLDYIKENYNDLIIFINHIIKEQSILYEDKSFNKLLDKVIKIIFNKLKTTNEITYKESEVLLYSLYYETLKSINLDKFRIEKMEFIEPDEINITKKRKGIFRIEDYPKTGIIYYNINNIKNMCKKDYPFKNKIDTMIATCHELIHARQIQDMVSGKVDLTTYILTIEELTNIMTSSKYYDDNYKNTMLELDANLRGRQCLCIFLMKHKLFNESQLTKLKESLSNRNQETVDKCNESEFEALGTENKTNINLIRVASAYIRRNPEVVNLFNIISISHTEEGLLKNPIRLLSEREKNKNSHKLEEIYNYIFNYFISFFEEVLEMGWTYYNEVEKIINYLESKDQNDKFEIILIERLKNILYPQKEKNKIKTKQI